VAAALAAVPYAHAAEQQSYAVALSYATPAVVAGKGDTLRFNNLDTLAQHDIASDTAGLFNSGLVSGGKSALVTGVDRLVAGSYAFHCSLHAWMKGSLVVGEAGAGGGPPPPPDTGDRPNPIDLAPRAPIEFLGPGDWPSYGHDVRNSRNGGPDGPSYNEVPRLGPAWTFKSLDGDFTGTPAVVGGTLVAGSFGGTVFALDARTGALRWKHDFNKPINGSAAIEGGRVFIPLAEPHAPKLAALDLATGEVLWQTVIDTQKNADTFGSPAVWNGTVYQGTSAEYGEVGDPEVNVRGSVVALDSATGALAWKTYTVPEGHDGGSVWTTPAIDPAAGRVFVGTGNAYHAPAADTTDSVMALDLATGAIVAHTQATAGDVWNGTDNRTAGPDHDFGASPNLFSDASGRTVLGIGQKAGVYWGFDRATLKPLWNTLVGPGTPAVGGVIGSTAFDANGVYGPATQPGAIWSLKREGGYRWYSADGDPTHFGPVSVSNGVVYSTDTAGFLNARDSVTGAVLAKIPLGSPSWGGIAIAGGSIFAATGTQGGVGWIVAYRGRDGRSEDQPGYTDGPPDATAPAVSARVVSARRGGVVLRAACSERCRLTAAGVVAGGMRTARVVRDADARSTVTMRLRVGGAAAAKLRRALARGRSVRVRVALVAIDGSANARTVRRAATLRR
jgi:polyvinyl alcohol dehydrogenase (cytochrome)